MKKIITLITFILISFVGFSQTKGISYQAVIIDPNPIQIPGSDVSAQPYVSKEVWIRFGIYAGTTLQYEELHKTKTDEYGLVNLIIGGGVNTGKAGTFTSLSWDGVTKNIITNVSFDQGGRYTEVSNQKLSYTPYTLLAETAVKLAGVLPIASGGTGATNAIAARTNLGLGNVDNTADMDKPVSTATLAILDVKESVANKSTNIIADSASSVKYPSVKAIKEYIDNRNSVMAQQAQQANRANLAAKATALETPRTINGIAFDGTTNITIPVGVTPPDADATTKGLIQLAGDLTGTADAPAIAANSVTTVKIIDGAVTTGKLAVGAVSDAKITSVSGSKVTGNITGNAANLTGMLAVSNGGTGATTASGALTNLGAEAVANKSTDLTADANSTQKYPSVKLIKDYVDVRVAAAGVSDGSITSAKIADATIVSADIAANAGITNAQLANSSLTLGTTNIALGGTATLLSGLSAVSATNFSGALAGNASTATKLAATKNINGSAFDGSSDITVTADATTLTGVTLASNVLNSSLTSVGTITSGIWSGTAIANNNLANSSLTLGSTNITLGATTSTLAGLSTVTATNFAGALTGNASTATKLAATKNINGVAFDGSADITVTADATTLTGIVPITKGGTGATTASGARTNLGLVIGTDVQAPLTAGTDYLAPTGSAANLTNFPILNQSTTGNAATATLANNISATANTSLTSLANLTTVGTITSGIWSATTIDVAHGGTGATSLTGLVKGNGTGAFSAAVAGVDFETAIAASTQTPTAQYWRGDKTWQTLTTDVVPELTNNQYFTKSRVLGTELANLLPAHGVISTTDNVRVGFNKLLGNQLMNLSTGVFTFTGITVTGATSFNVGSAEGYIVDNTTDIEHPSMKYLEFAGATGLSTPYLASHTMTYLYLDPTGALQMSGTELTPAQRRQNILLGKLGHPDHTNIISYYVQPDVLQSPLSQLRDVWQPIRLVNDGFTATANGANLNFNTTAGTLFGLGIGYGANPNSPSSLAIAAKTPVTFQYRTQIGGANTDLTLIDPTKYDNAGTLTTVAGTGAHATNQRIFLLQNGKIRVQYGQTDYTTFANAIAGIQSESFSTYAGIKDYGILIGILTVRKDATHLSDPAKAQFFNVTKFGETIGATSGTVTSDLQQSYNNGAQIITNSANGAFDIRRGSAADTDNVVVLQNGAGTPVLTINGAGTITSGTWSGTAISVANGGTGSTTKNFVDLTTAQTIAGAKTFSSDATINGLTVGLGTGSQASNAVLGKTAMANNTTGNNTVAIGFEALKANTFSNYNTAIGSYALSANNNADANVAVGVYALTASQSGGYNTAVGSNSLAANINGYQNTAVGNTALFVNTSGIYNTAVGNKALFSNTTGSNNTAIGHEADVASAALTNATAIGNGAIVNASNKIQLGNASVTSVNTSGTITAAGFSGPLTGNASTATLANNISATANTSLTTLANLTSVGTITSGTWSGTVIDIAHGGTGSSTVTGAKTNLGLNNVENTALSTWAGSTNLTTVGNLSAISKTFMFQDLTLGYGTPNGAKIQTDANNKYISFMPAYGVESTRLWPSGNVTIQHAGTYTDNGYTLEVGGSTNIVGNTTISGTLSTTGTISSTGGFAGPLTGNASTATKLATSRAINGVSFDGSGDITIAAAANTLTGTSLASNVVTSSLTGVGTITSGTWNGSTIGVAYGGTGVTSSTGTGSVVLSNSPTLLTPVLGAASGTSLALSAGLTASNATVSGTITANAFVGNGSGITNLSNSATTATDANTASAIVARDANGNFSANVITGTLSGTAAALTTGRTISTTGDVAFTTGAFNGTSNVTGSATLTNTAVTAGSYGSTTAIPTFTVDSKGRLTAAGTASIIAEAGTLSGTTLASNVVTSSLTSVGTITSGVWSGTEVEIAKGGTGATTAAGARTNLGLGSLATKSTIANADVASGAAIDFAKLNITRADIAGLGIQDGLTAGSGISLSSGTISVTGLTSANLTSSAGITNGQLANSSTVLGNTTMTLGGTVTSVTGLVSVSSTGFTGALTGNASTATKLATSRAINGVSFDGSSDITIAANSNTLTGTTLASNVVTSSLTGVGTITSGVWSGTVISSNKGGAGSVSGILKANGSGVVSAAVAGTDYQAPLTAGTSFIAPNAAITAATKTKITYDAFGLITAGADATTADIAPSSDKRYVTDVQSGVLSNTSGTNTGDETASTIKTKLGIATLSGSNTGDQTITLTGDVTGTGTGSFAATLTNTAVTSGTYGSSTAIPTFTVDAKGRLTAAGSASIIADAGTLSGTTLKSTVTGSSLTGVATITSGTWNGSTIGVAYGGTGVTASTGSGSLVLNTSPTLVTPNLGTPSSVTLTNGTGLPISTGVSGLGTGVATFLATPTSANLAGSVTDETGSGVLVFATSPTLVTPVIGAATGTSLSLTGNLSAAAGTFSTTLTAGATTLASAAITGDLAVNTNKFTVTGATGNTAIAGTLAVTGATTLSSTLTAGTSTLASLSVTNNETVGGTLGVTGATTLGNTLFVTGAGTFSSTLSAGASTLASASITGAATVGGTLGVTGATTLTGAATISNTAASSSTSTGALVVKGGVGVAGNLSVGGTIEIDGGTPGAGKVLISDANGVASWSNAIGSTVLTSTTTYAITLAEAYVFYNGASAGAFTIPAAASTNAGKAITIKNKTAFGITITPLSSGTIYVDNATGSVTSVSIGIEASNNWIKLVSDGAQWNVIRALF